MAGKLFIQTSGCQMDGSGSDVRPEAPHLGGPR